MTFADAVLQTPTTWLGILGAVILAVPGLLGGAAAVQGVRNRRKIDDVQSSVDDANGQLKNGHATNLRDDLTQILHTVGIIHADVKSLQDRDIRVIREDISGISQDLRALSRRTAALEQLAEDEG